MFASLWAWLVEKCGSVIAKMIAVVVLVALIFAPFYFTWKAGWNARDATAIADSQAAKMSGLQQLVDFEQRMQGAVGDYVLRRGQDRIVIQNIKQEIPHVVTVYKTAPGADPKPLPQCVFTTGFVRLWNNAMQDPTGTAGSDGADSGSQTPDADLYDSGVGQAEVLGNHTDNAEVMRELRRRLKLAQDYIKNLEHLEGIP